MKILFIGNRFNVLDILLNESEVEIEIFAQSKSLLERKLLERNILFKPFSFDNKSKILDVVFELDYNVLITNGCPFIIPTDKIDSNKILINIHPTFLPQLRGATALNGVFYNRLNFLGATMHFISEKIDGGNIIYQEKIDLTEDIDQGLIYFISFKLEGIVFKKGWKILKSSNFTFKGIVQNINEGSYFNRTVDKMQIDFENMNTDIIIRKIKSFGIIGQGCEIINSKPLPFKTIFDAEFVSNPFLNEMFINSNQGEILLEYDQKYLLKTIDGIIKVTKYA